MNIPVVLIIYRRPDLTKRIIDSLRKIKPKNIYVFADGPKSSEEKSLCQASRSVINSIDWPCRIHKIYAKDNMGLRNRVASGLNYVFKREKWAIILEDDLIVDSSFFIFCKELLQKYEMDERIISISGNNFQFGKTPIKESYYFSRYVHSWGWATWKRAWNLYDDKLNEWVNLRESTWLAKVFNSKVLGLYWKMIFDMVYDNKVDSWAYRWTYSSLRNNKLTIIPRCNLASNIGFGKSATHTGRKSKVMGMQIESMKFPLRHPQKVVRNGDADKNTEKVAYLNPIIVISLLIRSIVKWPYAKRTN